MTDHRYNSFHGLSMLLICALALLLSAPMLTKGMFIAYDIHNHMCRLAGTVLALLDKQFPPLIGPNLANGFGYSWNIFYPPLSTFIPAFFKIFLPTLTGAMKLFIYLTLAASGITMYHLAYRLLAARNTALLAAIIYMTAPYHLQDIYSRGALAEALAFVFIPLLFHGLVDLFYYGGQKDYYLTLGAAGLLLSHNLSSLLAALAALIYILAHIKLLSKAKIRNSLIVNGLFTAAISLFFLIPLLEHRLWGNYQVFVPNMMGSLETMAARSLYPQELLFTKFEQKTNFALGLQLIIPLCLLPFTLKRIAADKNLLLFLLLGLAAIFMTTRAFPWLHMPAVFSYIQFPWRFLLLAVFFLSIPCAHILALIYDRLDLKHIVPLLMLILIYIFPILTDQIVIDKNIGNQFYTRLDIITAKSYKTNGCATFEYLPVKAYNNIPYLADRTQQIIVKSGAAHITNEIKHNTNLSFYISSPAGAVIELPYIYYLGYDLKLITEKEHQKLKTIESDKGMVAAVIPAGTEGLVTVTYSGTFATRLSYLLSFLSLLSFISWVLWKEKFRPNR
ncbi:MAG: hypothetical protein GX091_01950 [Peptococcaceae bacterium]|nr:hypothetical protein [Peptococcaceae bacterium]